MSMDLERHCKMLSLSNLSSVALYVTSGVGGWVWPISMKAMHVDVPLWQCTKRAPSSASIELVRTFIMVVYST